MSKKTTISFAIKNEHLDYLDEKAKELGMSRSSFISMMISQHMQQQDLVKTLPELVKVLGKLDRQITDKEKEV
jgi:metal-responsive CopG/Arc/MetJ family transcriptional regulator